MLNELDIESYAVVDRLRVGFRAGLNVLTGETGSGKSIVVDSLALLLGARASVDAVRSGARRARVSGRFDLPGDPAVLARLDRSGIDLEGDEIIVERQVLAAGKSRAYVNGSPVTVGLLRVLAPALGDIHGQHEQQTLLSPAQQLGFVDSFAACGDQLAAVGGAHRRWTACRDALRKLKGDERDRLRRIDLLRYQLREIGDAAPQPGEDEQLQRKRDVLANVERLRGSGFEAYAALYDSSHAASARIKSAAAALSSAASAEERYGEFARTLEDARSAVDDVAFELRAYLEGLEADPRRLEALEDRLAELEKLMRKYGPRLGDVLAFAEGAAAELASLDRRDEEIDQLERRAAALGEEYERNAAALSRARSAAAADLAGRTESELRELALAGSRFLLDMRPAAKPGPRGVDRVAALFCANPGQPPRPLGQVASGGELSRIALALKTSLGESVRAGDYRRALVFDEVDSGVGGRVAEAIGRRLQRLSAGSQVLCVTHLPQIACLADAHYHVAKESTGDAAAATVRELSLEERIGEIARMLSGAEVSGAALENARQLLGAR